MSEEVLVVQNSILEAHVNDKSLSLIIKQKEQILSKIINNHTFMPRHLAEYDFRFKQIIPYVIIRNSNNYLLLKRTNKQTEKRLHNKYSLGIGGHINPNPSISKHEILYNGLHKELNEEIAIDSFNELNFIGIIFDEASSVSKVHLGLLYIYDVGTTTYEILEKDKMTGQWVNSSNLIKYYNELETWSQIFYDCIIKRKKA